MNFLKRLKQKRKPLTSEAVAFSYTDKEILKDVTLNLKESELVSIIGKSGCGKSTFLKLVAGIISKKHAGKIKIFGHNKIFSKSKLGFVPQEFAFIPDLSIEDNIKIFGLNLGLSETKSLEKARELMTLLKLNEDIHKKPTQLSGGQKVRLNILLSFLHDPQILILDEPFVGLDFLNRRLLWHFLETMKKKKKSIILTSHLLTETQEHVDKLIILKDGKIFFKGNLENLKSKLKTHYILELRFSYLSKENYEKIKKYCNYHDIKIMDAYEKYIMLGINKEAQRNMITKTFDKLNLKYKEISYREPNLDEVFLSA